VFEKITGQRSGNNPANPASRQETAPPRPISPPAATPQQQQQPAPAASAPRPSAGASRNVLSSDVEIKGTVKFTNDLVVDGRIEGQITSDGSLTVGENARLRAEISTNSVIVYGKVHGNIIATDRVELKSSAEVVGDIKAKSLTVEAGAIFVGKSTVGTPSSVGAAEAAPAAAKPQQAPAAAPAPAPAAGTPVQGQLGGTSGIGAPANPANPPKA
jgi:cytoskeletal protein CcmA (bactofilin family)